MSLPNGHVPIVTPTRRFLAPEDKHDKMARIIAGFYDYNLGPIRGLQTYSAINNVFAGLEYQEILFFHGGPVYYGARPDSTVARQWPFQDAFSLTDVREVTQNATDRYIGSTTRREFNTTGVTLQAHSEVRHQDNQSFKFCEGDTNFWYRCASRRKAKLTPRERLANLVPRWPDAGSFNLNPLSWSIGQFPDEPI